MAQENILKWRYFFLFSSLLFTNTFRAWSSYYKSDCWHDLWKGVIQAVPAGDLWLSPLLVFHPLGDSSVGHVEELAEFSVAVFQFLPFPAATSDLNMKKWYFLVFPQLVRTPQFLLTLTQRLLCHNAVRD